MLINLQKTINFWNKAYEEIAFEILEFEFSKIWTIGHVTKIFPDSETESKIMGLCKVSRSYTNKMPPKTIFEVEKLLAWKAGLSLSDKIISWRVMTGMSKTNRPYM